MVERRTNHQRQTLLWLLPYKNPREEKESFPTASTALSSLTRPSSPLPPPSLGYKVNTQCPAGADGYRIIWALTSFYNCGKIADSDVLWCWKPFEHTSSPISANRVGCTFPPFLGQPCPFQIKKGKTWKVEKKEGAAVIMVILKIGDATDLSPTSRGMGRGWHQTIS